MGKIEAKKLQKREALLESAFHLFTSKGIQKTSIADIVENSGVAKGTFYLYFHDKYDISDKLIARKASQLFMDAYRAMDDSLGTFEDRLIFITDHILTALSANHLLLKFISKNLSWGVYRSLEQSVENESMGSEFLQVYHKILEDSAKQFRNAELMLYMIIELVNSTCYSSILYGQPIPLAELKPELYDTIRMIMKNQEITA